MLFDSLIYFHTAELFIPLAVVIFIACYKCYLLLILIWIVLVHSASPLILVFFFFLTHLYMHVHQNVINLKEYVQSLLLPFFEMMLLLTSC